MIDDLLNIFENELSYSIKNKDKLLRFEYFKMCNICKSYNSLNNDKYYGGYYNIFLIKEPKYRVVMSLNVVDKLVNHYICKNILIPKLSYRLDDRNVATRKNMGTSKAINLVKKYIEYYKRYNEFYVLKMDIQKYFYSIDHNILKNMLKKELNINEFNFISNIIDSTNYNYVREKVKNIKERELDRLKFSVRKKEVEEIPINEYGKGLPIGNLTSQFLAIYYLNELDHYIIHDLKINHYVRYMDDFILFSNDKEYLNECYKKIEVYLNNKLKLNVSRKKCMIHKVSNGFIFLGYRFRVINNKTIIKLCRKTKKRIKRKIKENKYLIDNNYLNSDKVFCSINTYIGIKYSKKWIKRNIEKYFFN